MELAEKVTRLTADIKACKRNEEGLGDQELTQKLQKLRRQRDKEEYFHGLLSSKFNLSAVCVRSCIFLHFAHITCVVLHVCCVEKQDKLLFVSLYILLNLAEEPAVEKKMVKKDLISRLDFMISRRNADLLVITVTMLRKLSIIEENKDTMRALGVVPKLVRFIPCSSQALVNNVLRLLFNLSFDKECRGQMIRAGLLPKLVKLLATQACFRGRSLKLLYHLSADDTCKSMFSASGGGQGAGAGYNMNRSEQLRGADEVGGIALVLGMIVNFPQDQLPKELAALAVNLTYNKTNCQLMIQSKAVSKMVERYMNAKTKDSLLMKILRNLSLFTFNFQQDQDAAMLDYQFRGLWSPHIKNLVLALVDCDNHDVLVEILGTMANLTLADLPTSQPWSKFIKEYDLISLLSKLLIPGMSQNDVILEVVMLVSAMLGEPEACALVVATNIVQLMLSMWREKGKHDLEILLQLIYCIYRLLSQESSRDEVLYGNRVVVTYLIEALDHQNNNVRRAADQCLELVVELDRKTSSDSGSLSSLIKKKRFESYNSGWLAAVSTLEQEEDPYGHGMGIGGDMDPYGLDGLDPDADDHDYRHTGESN